MQAPGSISLSQDRELEELRAYLGPRFEQERLERYEQLVEEELRELGDEARLYRSSEAYLYDLTAFAMSGTKLPYLQELVRALPPPARVLDYGCGIGSDGLLLIEAGYDVAFADFDNPSTRYLRWRLDRRRLSAPVYDLDREPPPGGFDLAYAFDVIEHVDDPFSFLTELERRARLVLVNFLEAEPGGTTLHRTLPVRRLVLHAASRRLVAYRRYHGRSHLVLYGPERPGLRERLASLRTMARGRLRR